VYRIEQDSFDYVFTSYAEAAGKQPMLSFNHRSGRTCFVKTGEKLDAYVVATFEPATAQVFDPTLNTLRKSKAGRVTLRGPEDRTVVLELGKPFGTPGWRAQIVSLTTGSEWSVRAGDKVSSGATTLLITGVSEQRVTAAADGRPEAVIPPASDEEKVALFQLRKQQQEEREQRQQEQLAAAARAAQTQPRMVESQALTVGSGALGAGRVLSVPGYEPRFFVGTEYLYPTEYQIWMVPQGRDGRYRTTYVPTKFETRRVGTAIGPGPTVSHTTVSPQWHTFPPAETSPLIPFPQSQVRHVEMKIDR
jgi:hypothetical protein